MSSPAPAAARIAVVGAGPGGLTGARILQRHGLAVTVYDQEAGLEARNQGGTLDLHADDGQVALREAGLLGEFFRLARPEGQEMREPDTDGKILRHHIPAPGELFKPEIDRGQLRDLLLGLLQPGTVRWGQAVTRVSGPADGPRTLHFADGERGLFAQRNGGGHIRVYIIQQAAADWIAAAGLSTGDTAALRARNPTVTLLGDAAHVMPPLGVGVNLAMLG